MVLCSVNDLKKNEAKQSLRGITPARDDEAIPEFISSAFGDID
jgi:hypothetical protein